ncbi:hypothetical protein AX16_003761 [Volvariella volvacea WC 439]|nr:hypothetical protein AX16_003761 [Volvariella volvacea WC 439]
MVLPKLDQPRTSRNQDGATKLSYTFWGTILLSIVGIGYSCSAALNAFVYHGAATGRSWKYHAPSHVKDHCAHIPPIPDSVYLDRQQKLAETLVHINASAYIAEPGANALFYANVSSATWRLSERPLLVIIAPQATTDGDIRPTISILTPKFEATRAKLLSIPSANAIHFVEWAEESDPYQTAISVLSKPVSTIYVDNNIRHFLADGLQRALPHSQVVSAPLEITQLRERKSSAEIEILKCANEATLLAVRDTHSRMYIGMKESEARSMMSSALSAVGLKSGGCLTLFGENAALPHGSGTDRVLGSSDFALFDCTASLHGYWSDITRTVALPESQIPKEHLQIWSHVHDAQIVALRSAGSGALTSQVDEAARGYLGKLGYAEYFTHRLGHGIGLEVHEQPYLRGGSNDTILPGHTFSDEPGIYIENKVGVRLEDCFYINENGDPVLLTEGAGGQSHSPWAP